MVFRVCFLLLDVQWQISRPYSKREQLRQYNKAIMKWGRKGTIVTMTLTVTEEVWRAGIGSTHLVFWTFSRNKISQFFILSYRFSVVLLNLPAFSNWLFVAWRQMRNKTAIFKTNSKAFTIKDRLEIHPWDNNDKQIPRLSLYPLLRLYKDKINFPSYDIWLL